MDPTWRGGQVYRPPDRGQVGGWQNRGLPTPVNEPHGGNRLKTSDDGFVNRVVARGRCKMGQMAVVNGWAGDKSRRRSQVAVADS